MSRFLIKAAAFALMVCSPFTSPAAMLSPGDILVADIGLDPYGDGPLGIFKVDPVTGNRTTVSGFGYSGSSVGSGPSFLEPFAVVAAPGGDLYVSGGFTDSIYRVDPDTGNRTRISGPGVGTGPAFDTALGIALDPDSHLIVTTSFRNAGTNYGDIYQVDLTTGDRTRLSSSFHGIGTGPELFNPADIAIDASGQILVSDTDRILKIDPVTGNRAILSGQGVGAGIDISTAGGIALEASGDLLVTDFALDLIWRVDLITGDREYVSGGGLGSGPALQGPTGLAVNADGTIFIMNREANALYSIDHRRPHASLRKRCWLWPRFLHTGFHHGRPRPRTVDRYAVNNWASVRGNLALGWWGFEARLIFG